MELFYYLVFGEIGVVVLALELSKTSKDRIDNIHTAFNFFKNNYLLVYSLMMGMSRPPDRGRGRGNSSRGRGNKPRVTHADIEAYLKANNLQYPSLQDAMTASTSSNATSMKEVVQVGVKFITSPATETIMVLEPSDIQMKDDPWEIKSRYLDQFSFPIHEEKHRVFYETILSESGSVEISHTYDTNKPGSKNGPMSYSKAIIKMVIPIHKWGISPHKSKSLSIRTENGTALVQYNYWDYVEAWTKVFYYQNPKRKHSWFIKLCPNILMQNEFPNWFLQWWPKFRPSLEIFPDDIRKEIESFIQLHPQFVNNNQPEGKSSLIALTTFGIPWIWKWNIQYAENQEVLPILQRIFETRWWPGIEKEETIKTIKIKIQEMRVHIRKQGQLQMDNPFLKISAQIKSKNPDLSAEQILVKTMDFMKQQFVQTLGSTSRVADDESMTSAKSMEEDNNHFECLAGESQDPYEDEGNTPTIVDYWDSMTHLLADQLAKKKGKDKADQ